MRIDYKNKNIIRSKDVHVHDATFEGFTYQEEQQKVSFRIKNRYLNKYQKIDFYNTIGISCELCKFWGISKANYIYDLDLCDEEVLTKELEKKKKDFEHEFELLNHRPNETPSLLEKETLYIETYFLIGAGDKIRIVCEYIEFEEEPLEGEN